MALYSLQLWVLEKCPKCIQSKKTAIRRLITKHQTKSIIKLDKKGVKRLLKVS